MITLNSLNAWKEIEFTHIFTTKVFCYNLITQLMKGI